MHHTQRSVPPLASRGRREADPSEPTHCSCLLYQGDSFKFPLAPCQASRSAASFLDFSLPWATVFPAGATFSRNVERAKVTLAHALREDPGAFVIFDAQASPSRPRAAVSVAPTITRSKAERNGYWLLARLKPAAAMRPLSLYEYGRLFGWEDSDVDRWLSTPMTPPHVRSALGNSIHKHSMGRLLESLLGCRRQ